MKKPLFTGSGVAIVTPFTKETVDLPTLGKLLDFQMKNGTDAIIVCGTTGESSSLTTAERKSVLESFLEAAAGRGKRRTSTALSLLNVAYFVRRNSDRQPRDLLRFGLWYLRMLAAEFPKDIAGRRWDLPQVRGALMAGRRLPALLRIPRAELRDRYPNFQTELMTGTGPGHDLNNTTA